MSHVAILFILIPSLLIAAGVVMAARVVYRKIPSDRTEWDKIVAGQNFGPTFYQKTTSAVALKARQAVLSASTKFVYRLKITSLKTDNFFNRLLKEIREQKTSMEAAAGNADSGREVSPVKDSRFQVEVTAVEENGRAEETAVPETKLEAKREEESPAQPEERSSFAAQEHQFINQLAYNPKDVAAYKHLGWLYLENNKPLEARQAFKMAIKLGSRDKMIMAKLLEVGGVLHKEGTAVSRLPAGQGASSDPIVIKKTTAVKTKASAPVRAEKVSKPKPKKLRVKKV